MRPKITLVEVERLETKTVFNVFVDGEDTQFLAYESFKNGTRKYYPFSETNGRIFQKHKSIRCITTTDNKRPKGCFYTKYSRGYGFTSKKISDLFNSFQEMLPSVNEIVFLFKEGNTEIKNRKLYIRSQDFYKLKREIKSFEKSNERESSALFQKLLSTLLPSEIPSPRKKRYTPGSLSTFLDNYSNIKLSEDDKLKLKDLFVNSGLSFETIISTKTQLEIIYIEDVIEEFKKLMGQTTSSKSLEEKWHQFFKKHTWIFSQIFSFPAVYLKDKLNVGGQNIEGGTDKIADFLYKNKITNNITFIEIKTHLTPLINDSPYRNPDIFPVNSKLSGSIIQVLDQKNKLLKNYHTKIGNSARSLNSTCVVIAGNTQTLKKDGQQESFELFRWSNKDVIIITFDELLEKIEILLSIFRKS